MYLQIIFHEGCQLLNIFSLVGIIQRSHDACHRPTPFQGDYIEFKSFIEKSFSLKHHLLWHCQCRMEYSSCFRMEYLPCFYSGLHWIYIGSLRIINNIINHLRFDRAKLHGCFTTVSLLFVFAELL